MNIQRIISKLTVISLCFSTFFAFGTIPKVNGLDFVKVTPKFDTDRIGKVKLVLNDYRASSSTETDRTNRETIITVPLMDQVLQQ